MEATAGLALFVASIASLWVFLPRRGQSRRLLGLPFMESLVPLAITTGIALGATMAISGFH